MEVSGCGCSELGSEFGTNAERALTAQVEDRRARGVRDWCRADSSLQQEYGLEDAEIRELRSGGVLRGKATPLNLEYSMSWWPRPRNEGHAAQ